MNITCEHCGSSIDTEKDKKCPNCGAPYDTNKQYKEVLKQKNKLNEMDIKEKELNIHSKELSNQILESTINAKKFTIIPIMVSLLFIVIFFVIFYNIFKQMDSDIVETNNTFDNFNQDIIDINDEEEKIINVSFNENAISEDYEIKVDKITNYKYGTFETEEYRGKDINYYNFHIVFKNKTDSFLFIDNYLTLTYTDENGNENVIAKQHNPNTKEYNSQIESTATNKGTYTGNITFEIPKKVNDVQINYKNVEISINNFKNLITK